MAEQRPVTANLRVIINGYAADLEASGTLEDLVGLTKKLEALEIQPANSPLLWKGQNGNGASNGRGPLCPIHNRPMSPSKYGGYYCTAKVNGDFCKEKITA
ncbi:hypothetical protein BH23CHL2_BH23CHL2_07740 [soil metagenome]